MLIETWTAPGARTLASPSGESATDASAASSGSEVKTTSQTARASSSNRRVGALELQRLRPLCVAIVGDDLVAVGEQIGGEGLTHVAEAHDTDAFDGRPRRLLRRGEG